MRPKVFETQNFSGLIFFRTQHFSGEKNSNATLTLTNKFLEPKLIWDPKFCATKNFLGPKFFLGPKKIGPKIFSGPNIFRDP